MWLQNKLAIAANDGEFSSPSLIARHASGTGIATTGRNDK
jgi:hypothetical protein